MEDIKKTHRREFIKTTVKGSIIAGIGISSMGSMLESCSSSKNLSKQFFKTGFDQTPLPYKYDALENVIDAQTMEIHYTKHAAGYSNNLKEAAKAEGAEGKTVEEILASLSKYSTKMRNNAGGHYNHEMFWKCMRSPQNENSPEKKLNGAIADHFGSFENFKNQFNDAAKSRFGSGWAWLYSDNKTLKIGSTPNQDNPLMSMSDIKGFPLLGIDVWEHAYYLKYQNKRADYIENWWKVVNWKYVEDRFEA
ncbi:MAG: superoxide dismutase [Ginsengibacter sp.]